MPIFKSKKDKYKMQPDQLKKLDRLPIKYVCERDSETYKEKRIGENGAINIMDGDFVVVCGGKDVIRCPLRSVSVADLMNLSGITVSGVDKNSGRQMSVIAYFSDGVVRAR